ncbi:MAG: dihydrolipoyl dehydrogenase [Bacteroidia bacterium]|nr:dihydrolipoyl dehydrogenase [Bacteroidia bacterium]MDW8157369.1 dihydrolipoyl dehydrogenase [Bacteroidia bacterium]
MEKNYDLIVIGSGPGGYVAAIRASQLGLKTAVVERENLGGICLNWGCIPTKALLKSAEVMDYFNHASEYGFHVGDVKVDFSAIIKRSRDVADGMSRGIQFLFRKNRIQVLKGFGKLIKPGEVQVTYDNGSAEVFSAPHIIIATGGRARSLPGMEIDDQKIIGYRKAMTLSSLPKTMLIMGSGAIGTEFAYFYNTLGTKVTVIEYLDRILPAEDEDVSKQLMRIFKKNGIEILTSSKVVEVYKQENGVKAKIETPTGVLTLEADVLLSAVGVVANLEEIGLDKLGVKTENGKIKVNEYYQTNVPGIYAIGDIVHGPALAHKASAEGIICVEKIAGHHPEPLDYNNIPNCVYCQPEVASVGYTEQKAIAAGYQIKVGKFPFTASGKASAAGKKEGFVKVIFDAKYGEFLGAHMLGSNVTEMIAEVVTARKLETTGHEIIKSVHPHPTMSEAIMEAAADAYGEVIHL